MDVKGGTSDQDYVFSTHNSLDPTLSIGSGIDFSEYFTQLGRPDDSYFTPELTQEELDGSNEL